MIGIILGTRNYSTNKKESSMGGAGLVCIDNKQVNIHQVMINSMEKSKAG